MTTDDGVRGAGAVPAEPGVAARAARAVGAAFVSVAAWLALATLVIKLWECQGEGFQCLGNALLIVFAGLCGAAVTMWPLLRLAWVLPAWPVALVGPVIAVLLAFVLTYRQLLTDWPPIWIIMIMVAYGLAALITDGRLAGRWRLVVIGGLLALALARVATSLPG